MALEVRTKGRPSAEMVAAIEKWASDVSGKEGVVIVGSTKVLYRPVKRRITITNTERAEGEG